MKYLSYAVSVLLGLTQVSAQGAVEAPLKFKINLEPIKTMFKNRDQEILKSFADIHLFPEEESTLSDMQFSVYP
jgi:hypothetical protein